MSIGHGRLITAAWTAGIAVTTLVAINQAAAQAAVSTQASYRANLTLNGKATDAAERIMQADSRAITGKKVSTGDTVDGTLAGMKIVSTGLEVSVAGTPSAALRQAIATSAGGVPVRIRTVAHSERQLEQVGDTLTKQLPSLRKQNIQPVEWGPDYDSNKVLVKLRHYTPAAAAALTAKYGSDMVTVSTTSVQASASSSRTNDTSPWHGALKIINKTNNGSCTTGFNVVNANGVRYLVTASHCGSKGDSFKNSNGKTVGKITYWNKSIDSALIRANGNNSVWADPNKSTRLVRTSATSDVLGQIVVTDGATDREVMAVEVTAVNQTVSYSGYTVKHLVRGAQTSGVHAFSAGDSGGPVYQIQSSGKLKAFGEVVARRTDNASIGWYLPERYILSMWNLSPMVSV
jgi:hypothetical protein